MSTNAPLICPAPRSSLACENCRSRKARCLPSRKEGICQRCLVSRIQCVFGARKVPERPTNQKKLQGLQEDPRPNNVQQPASIVAEEREEDVVSGLFKPATPKSFIDNSVTALQDIHRRALGMLFPTMHTPPDQLNRVEPQSKVSISKPFTDANGKLSKDYIISRAQAEKFLQKYETMTPSFPFVILPNGWTLPKMLRDHPFMSLGIFCAVSASQPQLCRRMHEEFRKVFSDKVIVQQQQSLDIIQGLIVYLAWYPLHVSPQSRQIFHMLQMAISMAEDLNMDSHNPKITAENTTAAKRAYLGIFYLSSATATHKKKNKMEYTPYMDFIVTELAHNPDCDTDAILVPLFQLQACNDDISKLKFDYSGYQNPPGSLLDASLQSYHSRIQNIIGMISLEASENVSIILTQRFAAMNMYAQFMSAATLSSASLSAPPAPPALSPHVVILNIQATKDFYEALISRDASEYRGFTVVEWCRLILTTINIFHLLMAAPTLADAQTSAVGEVSQFGRYLEILCFRMGELSGVQNGSDDAPDVFYLWKSILRIVHERFSELAKEVGHSQIKVTAALCPIMSGAVKRSVNWGGWEASKPYSSSECTASEVAGFGTAGNKLETSPDMQSWEAWTEGLFDDGPGFGEFPSMLR